MPNPVSILNHGRPIRATSQLPAEIQRSDPALIMLTRHEQRRLTGLPTVSVLLGPPDLARQAWCRWCRQRAPVVISEPRRQHLLGEWIRCWIEKSDPVADATMYLARTMDSASETASDLWRNKSVYELQLIFDQAGIQESGFDAHRLCRWILQRSASGGTVDSDSLLRMLAESHPDAAEGLLGGVRAVVQFLPPEATPAALVVSERDASPVEFLSEAARVLTDLAAREPQMRLAVATSPECLSRYLEVAPESFAKAMLRENVVHVTSCTADEIRKAVEARLGHDGAHMQPLFEQLASEGASVELAERLADAVASRDDASDARSAVEKFLFELLEHSPDLTGLFQLNVKPGFRFGVASAEIDLACTSLQIAVEIDGYHHFKAKTHYRRDRRKDILLQRHGYLVLRFLAEDIVPQMQAVRETIRDAVQFRQAETDCNESERPGDETAS